MARVTKRQINARQKMQAEQKARYSKIMSKLRPVIILRLGIMNFIAYQEVLDAIDMFSEEEKNGNLKEAFEYLEKCSNLSTDAMSIYYRNMPAQYNYYTDICNVAYSYTQEFSDKMRELILVKYKEIGTEQAERKAQIGIANAMLAIARDVFVGLRKHNLIKNKIDVGSEFSAFDVKGALQALENIVHEYAQLPELEESIDFFSIPGIKDVYKEFCEYAGGNSFLNDMCKKAIHLNKDALPEVYEAIIGKDGED